jgi:hypothetical protein
MVRATPQIDTHYATEIRLYLDNDRALYDRKVKSFLPNIARKMVGGKYDASKAWKLWMYLVDEAVRKYDVEHGSGGTRSVYGRRVGSLAAVNKPTREAVAREMATDEEAALRGGEYGDLWALAGRKNPASSHPAYLKAKASGVFLYEAPYKRSLAWKNKTSGPPYHGHPSYAHWNAALWAGNEEWLYRAITRMRKDDAVAYIMQHFPKTPDGVRMTKTLAAYAWRSVKE